MDNLVLNQTRVKFSGSRRDNQEENKEQRRYFSSQMNQDYDAGESEFAAAVAAAAFAVHSLDQAELQYQRRRQLEALEISRSGAKRSAEIPSSSRPTRLFSKKEAKAAGESSRKISEDKASKQPNRAPSLRQATPGRNGIESKADAWEKAQMKKIQRSYEKMKSEILTWENEKKMKATLKMEKRKKLLEQRRAQNMQHYQNKVARIGQIAGGARAQLEEKRRNEELAVKKKAEKIRSGRNVPVKCFCFTC